MPNPGWGAVVAGNPRDVADWAHVLKHPFDPCWVEVHNSQTILRSTSMDELQEASDVRDVAIALIERLSGALALSEGADPLRFGGLVRFAPDGRVNHHVLSATPVVTGRPEFGRPPLTQIGRDGQPIPPPPPQPSEVQQWATLAENDELLGDALIYFGRTKSWLPVGASEHAEATDWFDIYKALECLILKFGPSEAAFLHLNWAPAAEVRLLKQTANWARHARRKNPRPPKPMEFEAARALLGRLIRRAFSDAGSSP